ncbi:Fnr-inducible formate dehydrogenase accessory protein FdhX [Shewanella sp. NFH-SH190041]|uniref:formate dehydrogenase n=1 Tax=Shewanella sp. NFH-SH190041 TaxID=2950245 RepID=UPI0021C2C562|nr:formate dehydrogenase [Shewanella sp. NFH-SH190041]BDM63745.1 Fnr-inducible formate dehydrogenase accessory protein FdhX [Shewanella sp. NFH-SH190041]
MKKQQPDLDRRSLLKALAMGSAAGVAIAAATTGTAQAAESKATAESQDGYHETAHIRAYYNTLRD